MAGARLGMADALDGDSSYLDAEQYKLVQQPLAETDADVGLVLTRRFAFLMVVAARPGSPAAKAGLQPGDLVKAIDERHTRPMPALVAERLMRGAPGSSVKLSVLRAGAEPFDVTVVRERLKPAAPEGRMLDAATGYVRIGEFTATTAARRARPASSRCSARAPRSLLLDLRDAAWGAPADGVAVAELFLQGGPVAKLVGRRADEKLLQADAARSAWAGPLAVLVTNGTAGPARGGGRGAPRRRAREARGRAHLRARGGLEDGAAARGRPGAHRREVHVAQGHVDPRPGPGARRCRWRRRTRTRRPSVAARPDRILEKALEVREGREARQTPRPPSESAPRRP